MSTTTTDKKTKCEPVKLNLVGVNGNAFAIMGTWKKAAKRQGRSKEEIAALASGRFLADLRERLPMLLNDNTRGEPGRWRMSEIKRFDVNLQDGRITGRAHFENASATRGDKA